MNYPLTATISNSYKTTMPVASDLISILSHQKTQTKPSENPDLSPALMTPEKMVL